jgi:nicotinate-nucleotide adenylyltransferase
MRVAFFGGSFNPPHVAHVLACTYVLSTGLAQRVLVVPVYQHPFDKPLAPFEDRLSMAQLAVGWIPGVQVSALESALETPSLTLNTLRHLRAENPSWELRLMVGSDVLFEAQKWHAYDEICALAPPLVLGRVGFAHEDAPVAVLPDLSSTRVRELLADPSPRSRALLRAMLPKTVLEHVEARGLYA